MARSARQSKIIEIIKRIEVDTQDDLVQALRDAGFKATQATVSRDIKELGLFKVSGDKKKYKYAIVEKDEQGAILKLTNVVKQAIMHTTVVMNQVVVKTLMGTAFAVKEIIERLSITCVLACIASDDVVLVVTDGEDSAKLVNERIHEFIAK